jgi:hypothetical protein
MAKGANSPKGEFYGAAAGLKPGLAEFSHSLYQSSQGRCHRRLTQFLFDEQGGQKLVHPLRFNMHNHQKLLLLRVLPEALEGGTDVLLTVVTTK